MHLSFTVLRMRRNGSRCCCRRSGALPPVCRLPFSEKIPQGPSVDDPKINLTLFRRGGGGQFRVPPRRPRRQEKETRFEGNFLPLLWLLPLLLPFYGRRAARATSASAGRRCCCCCCTFSDELHFFLCSFAPSSLPFLVFFHSAFQRNLLFFLSRNNPAEIETQISRTRTHPRRNREFRTRGAQPWATRANGNGTCRRPGREEPEHFHFSFPLCHPSLVVDNFPVTLSRGAVPQKKNLFHRRGAPTMFRL